MSSLLRLLLVSLLVLVSGTLSLATTPNSYKLTVQVIDAEDRQPLIGAILKLSQELSQEPSQELSQEGGEPIMGATNSEGYCTLTAPATGNYQLRVSYIGYTEMIEQITISKSEQQLQIALHMSSDQLEEVVVTAKASRGLTSSSLIGREAMNHLQPSSFGELLELLPGGYSSDPHLSSPNIIRLREATLPIVGSHNTLPRVNQSNYNTSSMGTTFLIDGVPQMTDAHLNGMHGNQTYNVRVPINAGVDMRAISTDEVEAVEVIRGIPSVEYANLTSGLIKIKRKQWSDDLSGRFKSDLSSKLFFLSKGVSLAGDKAHLTGSLSYLSAYADPRSVRDCYERITGSLRFATKGNALHGSIETLTSADYTATIDDRKRDQDLEVTPDDTYKASYHQILLSHRSAYRPSHPTWLTELSLTLSANQTFDKTDITKEMLLSRDIPYLTTKSEGEHEGRYYPKEYIAHHTVDSRPLYLYAKLRGESQITNGWSRHQIKWGGHWSYSKNRGEGAIFDLDKPLFWTASTRPRPFHEIPAKQVASLFLEDEVSIPIGNHILTLMGGAVTQKLLGLDKSYTMSRRWYTDLRLNARWSFAPLMIAEKPLSLQLLGGVGSLSMFPSMEQLYPETIYDDFVELNYYHSNPDYRLVYMYTYIYQPDSYQLVPARNLKYEVRLDADYSGYYATVTFFSERMRSGFRKDTEVEIANFKSYDPLSVPFAEITAKPSITDFTYSEAKEFRLLTQDTNGSETSKIGIEWMMNTPRYRFLNTRITFSGAWFRTTYRNSLPQYERPRAVLGGKEIGYVGRYEDNEILVRELLNTDLRFDTYMPKIKLGFSISLQANWYSSSQKMPLSVYPDSYIALSDGATHPYREADKSDSHLQWLKRNYNESSFERYVVPFMMITNLKATKQLFENRLRVALFVNKLFDYSPDIERDGYIIRRNQYPYFGMELVLTL